MFCPHCGNEASEQAVVCVKCGASLAPNAMPSPRPALGKSKLAYILLGVFLGEFGIHNFYAGYTTKGIIQLLITLFTCGIGSIASWIWALIEICTVQVDADGKPFTS